MLTNATTDIIVGLTTTEQQAATQDSNCIIEQEELWHAGLKYNQT